MRPPYVVQLLGVGLISQGMSVGKKKPPYYEGGCAMEEKYIVSHYENMLGLGIYT